MSGQPGRESAGVTHEDGRVTHEDDDVYRAADDGLNPDADDDANDGGDEGGDGGVGEAIAGELALMDPAVRASRALFERLLDPEFVEVGSSGRRYTYEEMLAWLPEHPGSSRSGPRYRPSAIEGVLLAPGLIHLTYETDFDGRRARRSSLWRKRGEETGWRMYYHQGTPVPPEAAQRQPASRSRASSATETAARTSAAAACERDCWGHAMARTAGGASRTGR
ncbi:hypothetical protein OV320_5519 [Actinobacteria bacterium OV320]|nr:hypothetical protein OV320_5519 [Actinobacteria bacterium OV320]